MIPDAKPAHDDISPHDHLSRHVSTCLSHPHVRNRDKSNHPQQNVFIYPSSRDISHPIRTAKCSAKLDTHNEQTNNQITQNFHQCAYEHPKCIYDASKSGRYESKRTRKERYLRASKKARYHEPARDASLRTTHTWPMSGNTNTSSTTQILSQHTHQPQTRSVPHSAPITANQTCTQKHLIQKQEISKHRTQNTSIHPKYETISPIVTASNTPSKPDIHTPQMSIYPAQKPQVYTHPPCSYPTKTSKIKPKTR